MKHKAVTENKEEQLLPCYTSWQVLDHIPMYLASCDKLYSSSHFVATYSALPRQYM